MSLLLLGARSLAAAALLALCLGMSACGSGGSAATTAPGSASTSTATTSTAVTPAPTPGDAGVTNNTAPTSEGEAANFSAQRGEHGSGESAALEKKEIPPTLKHEAGNAVSFLTPHGDNSIPTYGSEAPSSEQSVATKSLRAYLEARAGGDWAGACAHMGAQVQKQVQLLVSGSGGKSEGCAAAYLKISSRGSLSERANPLKGGLVAFRVDGENAFALFYGPGNQQYMMPMVSEGGSWKVNQIVSVAYPIGTPSSP